LFLKTYQENLRTSAHYQSTLAVGEEGFFNADAKGGKEPYTFEWKFSDGAIQTAQNATRSFDSPGRYDVRLTVIDADGQRIGSDLFVNVVSENRPEPESAKQAKGFDCKERGAEGNCLW
jgi:PKD domain